MPSIAYWANAGFRLLLASAAAAVEPAAPAAVSGLVAWYRAETPQARLGDDQPIPVWSDDSGRGHDLVATTKRLAHLRTNRLGGKAIVQVHKQDLYEVKAPFELADHTIFLVVRQRLTDRALFRSDTHADRGLVLGEAGKYVYRDGETGRPAYSYTPPLARSEEFRLVVLGRERGRMRGFIDGGDRSSMARSDAPIRVGAFFELTLSKQAENDGEGLELAEMAFYERYLGDDERRAVTAHLAQKFDLTLEKEEGGSLQERIAAISANSRTGIARLGCAAVDLGSPQGLAVPWDAAAKVQAPWRREPAEFPTRLFVTKDEASAHIYLLLAVQAELPGVTLRVLLRKSRVVGADPSGPVEGDWLPGEASIGPFGGEGPAGRAVATFETRTPLAAGDFLEVWVYRGGTPQGAVHTIAGESALLVEAE